MKKLLVAVAVFMSMGTVAFAQSTDAVAKVDQEVVAQLAEEVFKEVKAENLNEKVRAMLATYDETYTVKKLEYNDEKKITRVTLEEKATQAEKVVKLDDEGKEVN